MNMVQHLSQHISERADADHQLARVRAGLFPVETTINPEKESKQSRMLYRSIVDKLNLLLSESNIDIYSIFITKSIDTPTI